MNLPGKLLSDHRPFVLIFASLKLFIVTQGTGDVQSFMEPRALLQNTIRPSRTRIK